MDKKKAYELADALESGEYKQGKGFLCKNNKFCCLGVAADLTNSEFQLVKFKRYYNNYHFFLTPELQKLTTINSNSGEFYKSITVKLKNGYTEKFTSLADMNDGGLSFKFIAKIVRKYYNNIV